MKVKIPLGLLLLLASGLGYLLGTEAGRAQRDTLIRIIRRQNEIVEATTEAAGDTEAAAEPAAETTSS